ncbi:hypothetical protein D3218_00390 [Aureimonas flava]|uniref:Uncharacterized protein n=1 Tax=Aureimonas flava TaxID=2320271 RepID=A0A3A1WX05_9HYPH|nr:hypothetical protein [Aureimonas flava]RIY03269.1 hypothetical protein D3218_00390 [Aureimonas flava]
MKQDFLRPLVQFNGEPMSFRKDEAGVPVAATLADLAVEALLSQRMDGGMPQTMSGNDHLTAYKLAERIHDADAPIDVTVEEVALVKRRISEHFVQPLVVGQALIMLEDSLAIESSGPPVI